MNEVAKNHGEIPTQYTELKQWHTGKDIHAEVMETWGLTKVREGISLLAKLGYVEVSGNPNPRYAFDKTKHFEVLPEKINAALRKFAEAKKQGRTSPKKPKGNHRASDLTHDEPDSINRVSDLMHGASDSMHGASDSIPHPYIKTTSKTTPEKKEDFCGGFDVEQEKEPGEEIPSPHKEGATVTPPDKHSPVEQVIPPAAVEVCVNSTDAHFLGASEQRREGRAAMTRSAHRSPANVTDEEIEQSRFESVENYDRFFKELVVRLVNSPGSKTSDETALGIAFGYRRDILESDDGITKRNGGRAHEVAESWFAKWKAGGNSLDPEKSPPITAASIKAQREEQRSDDVFTRFVAKRKGGR